MLQIIFLSLSLIVTIFFFFYGFNCYYLIRAVGKYRDPKVRFKSLQRPTVAIHLPIYNEKYVVRRLIDACAQMAESYGRDKVKIMVLDDSDDETTDEVSDTVQEYLNAGFKIEVMHRYDRQGFKAGALQKALECTEDEYIAIFDADFIPPADFLTETVPHLVQDERLAVVQCRWSHVNRDYNFITRSVAIGMDAHFLVEQPGRYAANCFQNFNGSSGVIRRSALEAAGGWHSDTLAEDLDASYRIQLKGYRILYLRDLRTSGEVTPTIPSFKRQQGRWACGSLQTAKKLLPALLKSDKVTLKQKVEAFVHLTYYAVHPLMFASFLLALSAAILRVDAISVKLPSISIAEGQSTIATLSNAPIIIAKAFAENYLWIILGTAIITCTVAAWIYYAVTLRLQGSSLIRSLPSLLILGFIGYGISVSNTFEAAKALLMKRNWSFKRTPKYAVRGKSDDWRGKKYHVPIDIRLILEMSASTLGLIGIATAVDGMNWGIIPILALYTTSYAFVGYLTFVQSKPDL